jgi:hypothetical protein
VRRGACSSPRRDPAVESDGDGGLVVDDVHGVRQRPLIAGERVGVELKHEDGALAGDHHSLLPDEPCLAALDVRATDLPSLKAAESRLTSVAGNLGSGQILHLARGVLNDLRRIGMTV